MCMPYLISLTISLTIFKVRDKHPLKTWQHRWEEAMNPPCPRCPRCPRPQVLPSNHTGFVYGPCLNNEVSWEQRPSLRTILWQESPRTVHGGLAGFSGHLWANRRVMQLKDHRSQWSAAKRMCCFPEFSLKVASFLRRFPKCRGPQNPETAEMFILSRNTVRSVQVPPKLADICKHFFQLIPSETVFFQGLKHHPYLQQPHNAIRESPTFSPSIDTLSAVKNNEISKPHR